MTPPHEHDCSQCPISHLRPDTASGVVQAPVYIRVRAGWLEKLLLLAVFVQIMLVLWMMGYGSTAARAAFETSAYNRDLLCQMLWLRDKEVYRDYLQCPQPEFRRMSSEP